MGVAGPRMLQEDTINRAIQHMLRSKATEQQIEQAVFKKMKFRINSQYELRGMKTHLRIAWQDPERPEVCRAIDYHLDAPRCAGVAAESIKAMLDSVDIKAELYFFRLNFRFPKRIKKVNVGRNGEVRIDFNNGRVVTGHEDDLESSEFLATCAMVYDL